MDVKTIVVLGRRDHPEAMRVAAGLTIFGHHVRLVLMREAVAETPEAVAQAELLAYADVVPETTVTAMADQVPLLDSAGLAAVLAAADCIINL